MSLNYEYLYNLNLRSQIQIEKREETRTSKYISNYKEIMVDCFKCERNLYQRSRIHMKK